MIDIPSRWSDPRVSRLGVDHWSTFLAFVTDEIYSGGPDPQLSQIAHIGRSSSDIEQVWLAGCYGASHCVTSAVAIWHNFRAGDFTELEIAEWLCEYKESLPMQPEMRSHKIPERRARCLFDFSLYAINESWRRPVTPTFESIWDDSIEKVKYYNRYMAIKYLDILRQSVRPDLQMNDIRVVDAWSPRMTLASLYPEHPELANRALSGDHINQLVETTAQSALSRIRQAGIDASFFQLQVLLCQYHKTFDGKQYAGISLDEELLMLRRVEGTFPEAAQRVLEARKSLFNSEFLGEVGGWERIRDERMRPFNQRFTE